MDCRHLANTGFVSFDVSFVKRSGNKVADYLARHAEAFGQTVWIEEVPTVVEPLVLDDVTTLVPT